MCILIWLILRTQPLPPGRTWSMASLTCTMPSADRLISSKAERNTSCAPTGNSQPSLPAPEAGILRRSI
ncbi:hypothetical protein EMPG_13602 [Blastomyces silverae]|uniref:Uncharacterized protein n=1 Tax=Blastomyces silverae TaxID=2060906 RepID=A0A0H1BIC5_9EURO|nr:hypothetical protein EMPG_13602 [Blastomyces silverae]